MPNTGAKDVTSKEKRKGGGDAETLAKCLALNGSMRPDVALCRIKHGVLLISTYVVLKLVRHSSFRPTTAKQLVSDFAKSELYAPYSTPL